MPNKQEPAELVKFKEEPSFHALAEHVRDEKSDTPVAKPFEPPLPMLEEPAKLPP
jgi:hypothetical protein